LTSVAKLQYADKNQFPNSEYNPGTPKNPKDMKIKSFKAFALSLMIPLIVTAAKGQSAYSNAVINLKPVAYWPLQETVQPPAANIETNYGSLGPIANGIYASDANTEKQFPGAIANDGDTAVEFTNNSQSFMIVPNTDNRVSLHAGGPLTVEAWAYPNANQQFVALVSQTGPIGSGGNNAGANTAGWSLNQNWLPFKGTAVGNNSLYGFSFHVFNGVGSTGGAEADAVYPFVNGNWYHVVGVYDGTNCWVYVNGVNATTFQIPMIGSYVPDTWDPIQFGGNRGLGANPYKGGIDEVAIYTNALSFLQVSNHYNIGVGIDSGTYFTTVLGDNPLMYWRMDAPVYTWPLSGYPTAANYGSLAAGITNYNTAGHSAVYQPGTLPGVVGPSWPGFGSFTNACAFNGLVGGVDAGYEPALDPTGDTNSFTVIGWFRSNPADNNGRFNTLAGHSDSSWRFKIQNGVSLWNYGGASGPQQSISPSTDNVNDGNWHMFAGIYDTTNVTEIIDGYYSSSAQSTSNIVGKATLDTFLGASPDYLEPTNNTYNTAQQHFAGRLAHVAFFTNALTASQIVNLYTNATETPQPPPAIVAQPFPFPSVRAVSGGPGTFIFEAVVATGTPLSYQWYFNTSSNYTGATALVDDDANYTNSHTSQVTITNLTSAQTGYYFCVASDSFGSATSAIVNVQVQMSPVITAQSPSGSFSLYPNQNVSLSVTALGAAPLAYQWYTNGVADTTAGTAATYSAPALVSGTTYQCVVNNGSSSATGALDTLTLLAFPPSIANSAYSTNLLGLSPTAYWPMHETETQPYLGDIETNYGSWGAIGNGYFQDWNTPVVAHGQSGAIAGSSDTAVEFYNTANDAIIVPHTSPKLTLTYPYSLEAWIKPEADNAGGVGSYMVIMGQGGGGGLDNGGGRAGFALQYSGTPQTFSLVVWTNNVNGNAYEQKTVAAYPPGVWYHLICTYDGTNVAYYVNGQQAGFLAGNPQSGFPSQMLPDSWSPFTIGAGRWGNGGCSQPFIGSMDEVAVYTNVLTLTQIQNHYFSGTNVTSNYFQTVQSDAPVLYYHMDAPTYVPPPTNGWPVLTNYGSVAINGVYDPSTIPGSAYGPGVAGLGATNAMPGNQVSAYADAGEYPQINPVNIDSFSCTFWFKGNPADNRWNGLMAGNDVTWRCLLNPSGQLQGHGNADTADTKVDNDGLWHQFVLTYQPSNGVVLGVTPSGQIFGTNNVYVDGILMKSSVGAGTNNPTSHVGPDVLLGNEYDNRDPVTSSGGRSLAGAMCEAAFFYHQVLTPTQIRAAYDAAKVPAFIVTQPRSIIANQSGTFTNSMVGDGADPLVYQWYYNTTSNYSGATKMTDNGRVTGTATSALADSSAAISDAGYYYTVVTNNYGYATSSIVLLTVNTGVVITNAAPIPYTNVFALYTGTSPTFSVAVAGASPIIYRWYTNGTLVAGATANSYTWNAVWGTNVACIVSNSFNTATNSWTWMRISTNGLPFYPQAALALHPSGFWRLNDTNLDGMDNGSGDFGFVCHDYAGGNDGLYTNAYIGQGGYNPIQDPSDSSCYFGYFANPGSMVGGIQNVDFSEPLGSNAEFSVEAWVYPTFTPTANTPCIAAKGYYFEEQFDLDAGAGSGKAFRFECRPANGAEIDADNPVGLTNPAALNQWYHLVGVCDEAHGSTYLYVNGALVASSTIPVAGGLTNALGVPMTIGCRAQNPTAAQTEQFLGYIDDVAVYPYALSASQIVNEYEYPPSITQQPVSSTNVDQNGVLTVSATASGTSPLSYEWYDNNAHGYISGQTNATLVISNFQASDSYYLTVNNPYGTTNSQTVTVTVATGLAVNPLAPASQSLYVGQPVSYSVSASGTLPIYYQWVTNGIGVAGATNASVNFIVPSGSSSVSCVVSNNNNGYTAITAGPVTLIGLAPPTYPYAQGVLGDHPIAFWRLNEPDNGLNDGNLSVLANDYVGGHDGAYTNVILDAGGYNPALDPATSAEFGVFATSFSAMTENDNTGNGVANLDFTQPNGSNAEFSVEAWVNGPVTEGTNSGIVTIGTWGNEQFTLDTGGAPANYYRLSLRDSGNNIHNAVSSLLPDGNWHHLVGVCDEASTNVYIYVDGALAGTSGNDIPPGSGLRTRLTPLYIGQRPGPGGTPSEQFLGTIADVALYNYPLTASQVAAHYALGTVGTLVNTNPTNILASVSGGTNLVLNWPLDHKGWRLQAQTNSVSVGLSTNWFSVANSNTTNTFVTPINKSKGTVFYRLVYP
jgi:hypothetical protein